AEEIDLGAPAVLDGAPAVLDGAAAPPSSSASAYTAALIPTGGNVFTRMADYYKLEWGQAGPPSDPNAPAARRDDYPPQPVTQPPYPFTEWPYGAATLLGASRPNSVDSPLMV